MYYFTKQDETAMHEKKRRNREIWKKCPVGTVIWCMMGRMAKDENGRSKTIWQPEPECIQQSNERGFSTYATLVPVEYGSTWGNIGRAYYLSREECLEAWGERPLVEDYEASKDEKPARLAFGEIIPDDTIIFFDGSSITTQIYVRVPFQAINIAEYFPPEAYSDNYGIGYEVTLKEIRSKLPRGIVTVFQVSALSGVAYQIGNAYEPKGEKWRYFAKTGGYA